MVNYHPQILVVKTVCESIAAVNNLVSLAVSEATKAWSTQTRAKSSPCSFCTVVVSKATIKIRSQARVRSSWARQLDDAISQRSVARKYSHSNTSLASSSLWVA